MFQGTIPQDTRRIMNEVVRQWRCKHVAVGCSGNFTVERVLAQHNRFQLHSCDVSLYTTTLGRYFAGEPHDIKLSDAFEHALAWLKPFLKTPESAVATVLLSTRLAEVLTAGGTVRDTPYHARLYDGYKRDWIRIHGQTLDTVKANTLQLADYHCGDATDWLAQVPKHYAVISYPPFYASGYERLFKVLEAMYDWDKPDYPDLDVERMTLYLKRVMNRKHWLFGLKELPEEYKPYYIGLTQTTAHGIPLYIFSSASVKRIVTPVQKTEPVTVPRLLPGEAIGETMTLAVLASVLGDHAVPASTAALLTKALNRMTGRGEIGEGEKHKALEMWAKNYLEGPGDG